MFRIAIVDDESCVRMGLKTIAEKEGLYTVVGEADNGASAVQMIMQKQPVPQWLSSLPVCRVNPA